MGPDNATDRLVYMRPERRNCSLELGQHGENILKVKGSPEFLAYFRLYHMDSIRYPAGITGASKIPKSTLMAIMAGKVFV